jgi:hypothetical protein
MRRGGAETEGLMARNRRRCKKAALHGPHGRVISVFGRKQEVMCPGYGRCQVCQKGDWADELVPLQVGRTYGYRHRGCRG